MDLDQLIDKVPEDVVAICRTLRDSGKRGWVVGGCVRDLLRGAPAKDWDVATDALPEEVTKTFKKVIPTGIQHGTVTVLLRGVPYEVTTLRGEGHYEDGRRPKEVVFLEEIAHDLARRDFTFNAIAIDPINRALIDPFGGREDLDKRVLRAVGVAVERFTEDGLRVLRAARFAATLECTIEDETLAAMRDKRAHDTLRKVSAERVHDEWLKTMRAAKPSIGFALMQDVGVLEIHCPELERIAPLVDKPNDAVLRVAALLSELPPDVVDKIMRRLKFSNGDRERVVAAITHMDPPYDSGWSDARVRRWLRDVTPARLADVRAIGDLDELGQRAEAMVDDALEPRDLAIGGKELMNELGMKPGPRIGDVLAALLEKVLDDPSLNEKKRLLEIATGLLALLFILSCSIKTGGAEEQVPGEFPCDTSEECPAPDTSCLSSQCLDGQCVFVPAPDGVLPEQDQVAGDCKHLYCDGDGGVFSQPAAFDLPPDDGNPCTNSACDIDNPSYTNKVAGTPCPNEGLCNGTGICGVCVPKNTQCAGKQGSASTQLCGDDGQWQDAQSCGDKPRCTDGRCVGIAALTVGRRHACARFEDNAIGCWGNLPSGPARPAAFQLGEGRAALGPKHACMVRGASAWCWGAGDFGQLGGDNFVSSDVPVDSGAALTTRVAVGDMHTCALSAKQEVSCWGLNDRGQAGGRIGKFERPATTTASTVMKPPILIRGLQTAAIEVIGTATCFVAGGSTKCLGMPNYTLPEPVEKADARKRKRFTVPKPRNVPGLKRITQLAAGANHTCALQAGGAVFCWGAGDKGQLGAGTKDSAAPRAVPGVAGATLVGAGDNFACALAKGGSIVCWGANDRGQLGRDASAPSGAPAAVPNVTAIHVDVGSNFACATIGDPKKVVCWGNGGATPRNMPW